jgi:glycosyltransferase involved in cell wall biosynthesis
MKRPIVVIPCFNEADRLNTARVLELLAAPADILFVDDGSTDATRPLLEELAAANRDRVRLLALPQNRGKGEAVRAGMRRALEEGAAITGYLDADLSTPPLEMRRVLRALDDHAVDVALGSRVRLLGSRIDRRPLRHYLGRVFGTAASIILQAPIYDTQCGAKAFRKSAALAAALVAPFHSRWAFDVELLSRLLRGSEGAPPLPAAAFLEVPLHEWRDVQGSKLEPPSMLKAGFDLVKIRMHQQRRR